MESDAQRQLATWLRISALNRSEASAPLNFEYRASISEGEFMFKRDACARKKPFLHGAPIPLPRFWKWSGRAPWIVLPALAWQRYKCSFAKNYHPQGRP